ncbi:MAG: heparinase II/III family protein [Saprospiraceae bacterium]
MKKTIKIQFVIIMFFGASLTLFSQNHPNLILTKKGVAEIRKNIGTVPMFDEALAKVKKEVDAEIKMGVKVPIPKDMAGGYTHERHKLNWFILQKAGSLYQITGDKKYAEYIRQNLLAYAKMFPSLPKHPTDRSYATGKIFWQCLNDANWLVYVSQAYDCVYDFIPKEERDFIEKDLFRPLAEWISTDNPKFFNRVHNHSTWANAGVGMIGLVMNDEELIQRALYGLKNDGLDNTMLDNDGGFIKAEGQTKAGFFAQLDYSFSPDGHFTEGPYYLRYAMTPFLLFAKSLANNRPDLKIYDYRNGILEKSIYSLLYETDTQGRFFPINDSQKGMSWNSREVVAAVDIAYLDFGNDPMLLSIAKKQGKVTLDPAGFKTAADIEKGLAKPFKHKSIAYNDGAEGKHGGLGILRADNADGEEICVVAKYAAHGMGHGHFDKLSYSLYDEDGEVIQDYGAARWVNIDQKGGGRYLKENHSYAKQTIAHNTLVVNEISHYEGKVKDAEAHHPDQYFFDVKNPNIQAVSAKDIHAYADATMHRTLVLLKDESFRNPILIDVFRVESEKENQYDLPTWFHGHLLSTNFDYAAQTQRLTTLGNGHGYQHIWEEANGKSTGKGNQVTWFAHQGDGGGQVRGKVFTMTTSSEKNDELIFARVGANDPNFNLRHDPVFIQRRKGGNSVFASVIESHGTYDPVSETPLNPFPSLKSVEVIHDSKKYTVIQIVHQTGKMWTLAISNKDASEQTKHQVKIGKEMLEWKGAFILK